MAYTGEGIQRSLNEAQSRMNQEVNKTLEAFELMLRYILKAGQIGSSDRVQ